MLEELIPLQLHLDHVALLLLGELRQVHHHKLAPVIFKVHTLRARGHHEPVAARNELIVHKCLDHVTHAGCLIHTIDKDHQRAQVVRGQQQLAALLVVRTLVPNVPAQHAIRVGEQHTRLLAVLVEQPHDALHVQHEGHQAHPIPCGITHQPGREQVHRLLDHPRLARAWPRAAEHWLCIVPAVHTQWRLGNVLFDELRHVGHAHKLGGRAPVLDIMKMS